MAYLFDGGFTGFLYSMRETGRKLKDGAKELVEDFISGFNGHGWKLWKRNNSWRLEVDELLVRKSLTTFEMIISQITSIKGSQAITQGNGKIKSVTLVDSADVYEETDNTTYNENFLSSKWYAYAPEGTTPNIGITRNSINFMSNEGYSAQGLLFKGNYTVKSFTYKVKGLTGSGIIYSYFENESQVTEEITEDGEYTFPSSDGTGDESQEGGFVFLSDTTGEIIQIPIATGITENVSKKPCYRIELENEQNTFTQYDLIRCQKGDKFYYVQVGSVFQYYLNIPISEFETNEEGIVTNPPQEGDEIIQFGNASHQEIYKNRHSAIYMHLDENEPAIDLMTDIYSKDWGVGNIIKTRIGGNLPGAEGDRGFYCVNGKILSVDEYGRTVYVINPDGSASFARGRLSWSKDGVPEFKGYIISGDSQGKRIEINPEKGSIEVYNEKSNLVNSIESTYYDNPTELFKSNISDLAFNSSLLSVNYPVGTNGTISDSISASVFKLPNNTIVVNNTEDEYWLYLSPNFHYTTSKITSLNIVLKYVLEKSDGSLIELDSREFTNVSSGGFTQTGVSAYKFPQVIGSYIPKIIVNMNATGTVTGYISFQVTLNEAYVRNLKYKSSFFSKGIGFGTDTKNVAMIWDRKSSTWGDGIRFDIENKRFGLKMDSNGIYIKHGYSVNTPSAWFFILPFLFAVKVNSDGSIASSINPISYDLKFTYSKSLTGRYTINFPTEIYDVMLGLNPIGVVIPGSSTTIVAGTSYISTSYATVNMAGASGLVDHSFTLLVFGLPASSNANDTDIR